MIQGGEVKSDTNTPDDDPYKILGLNRDVSPIVVGDLVTIPANINPNQRFMIKVKLVIRFP